MFFIRPTFFQRALTLIALALLPATVSLRADNGRVGSPPTPATILTAMQRVADWQLANPSSSSNRYTEDAWTWGAFYTGVMALSRIADHPKYHDAMMTMGKRFAWKPARRPYHADDLCVSQTYLELYLQHRDPAMLQPTKERLDYVLAHPSTNDLHFQV